MMNKITSENLDKLIKAIEIGEFKEEPLYNSFAAWQKAIDLYPEQFYFDHNENLRWHGYLVGVIGSHGQELRVDKIKHLIEE